MIRTVDYYFRMMTRQTLLAIVALTVFSSVIGQSQRGQTATCGCICSQEYIPVCGTDGRGETTFSNRCELKCCQSSRPGLREKFEGVCAEPYVHQEGPQGLSSGQSGSRTSQQWPRTSRPSYGQQGSRQGWSSTGSSPSGSSQQQWLRPSGSSQQQVYRPPGSSSSQQQGSRPMGPSTSQQQQWPRPPRPGSTQQQWTSGSGSGWVQSQTSRPAVQPSQGSSWGQNPSQRPAIQPPRGSSSYGQRSTSRPAITPRPWWQSSSSQQQQGGSNWRENRGVEDDDDSYEYYDERK